MKALGSPSSVAATDTPTGPQKTGAVAERLPLPARKDRRKLSVKEMVKTVV